MGTKRVLDVGNCDPDHGKIVGMLTRNFDVQTDRVMFVDEALKALSGTHYDLVLVNRRIFADDSDGGELIRRMKASEALVRTPVMLVSNFPDAQAKAVAEGAVPGFGKAAIDQPATIEMLAGYLKAPAVESSTPASR